MNGAVECQATNRYRRVYWRAHAESRRLYWSGRRLRSRFIGRYRRVDRSARLGVATLRLGRVLLRSQLASGSARQVFRELDDRFDQLLDAAGLDLGGSIRWAALRRLRFRLRLFGRLGGVAAATEQVASVELPARWNRRLASRITDARFIEVSTDVLDSGSILWILLPVLASGRPVAIARRPGSFDHRRLPEFRVSELCRMEEHELARVALEQLRAVLVGPPEMRRTDRPVVTVVMSTNRRELVDEAVGQIQRQRGVEIELIIGCHGFSPDEIADVDLQVGAVSSATVLGFDSSTLFGDVLRTLSGQATSPFVTKWDDDDLYGVHHVLDLWLFAVLARTPLVGKAAEFVLLEKAGLLVRRRGAGIHRSTRFLAGGALLMSRRGLDLIGGWGSLPRSVDQDIIRRFDEAGLSPIRIHGYEFVLVRHHRGHTWDPADGYFEAAADEIRSAEAMGITHVVEPAESAPRSASGLVVDSPTFEICVPNQNEQISVALFEWQRRAMTPCPRLTVCDDRSDPPLVTSSNEPGVQVVRAPEADGFGTGRSRHTAFEHSESDVIVFADADMYLEPRVMGALVELYRGGFAGALHAEISFSGVTATELLSVSSQRRDDTLSAVLEQQELQGQGWRQPHWTAASDYAHPMSSTYRATVGAFLVIDRASYVDTGGFRDLRVRGVEDIEFGYRLQSSGCPQGLWRDGGIWHLGERTFATHVDAAEEDMRNMNLCAYIPIWARSLHERRKALDGWCDPIVPFVELPAGVDLLDDLRAEFGEGAAVERGAPRSILSAPFAIADSLSPRHAIRAIDLAFEAFRNRRGGEVIVVSEGRQVGRFLALWALNLAARRAGTSAVLTGAPVDDQDSDTAGLVRRDFGISVVAID